MQILLHAQSGLWACTVRAVYLPLAVAGRYVASPRAGAGGEVYLPLQKVPIRRQDDSYSTHEEKKEEKVEKTLVQRRANRGW